VLVNSAFAPTDREGKRIVERRVSDDGDTISEAAVEVGVTPAQIGADGRVYVNLEALKLYQGLFRTEAQEEEARLREQGQKTKIHDPLSPITALYHEIIEHGQGAKIRGKTEEWKDGKSRFDNLPPEYQAIARLPPEERVYPAGTSRYLRVPSDWTTAPPYRGVLQADGSDFPDTVHRISDVADALAIGEEQALAVRLGVPTRSEDGRPGWSDRYGEGLELKTPPGQEMPNTLVKEFQFGDKENPTARVLVVRHDEVGSVTRVNLMPNAELPTTVRR
jgi:hypothetical protein